MATEERAIPFHNCAGMEQLSEPPPYFFTHEEAVDTATGETFTAVMLAIPGQYQYIACQVDYCPWCGEQLCFYSRKRSGEIVKEREGYALYRKRHVKLGILALPMVPDEYDRALAEYEQTKMLIPFALDAYKANLEHRLKVLSDRLGLEVVLETGETHADRPSRRKSPPDRSGEAVD